MRPSIMDDMGNTALHSAVLDKDYKAAVQLVSSRMSAKTVNWLVRGSFLPIIVYGTIINEY